MQQPRCPTMIVLMALVIGLVPLAPSAAQDGPAPGIAWGPCPMVLPRGEIDGQTVQCGTLTVPQDRTQPGGTQVQLAIAIVRSRSASPAPDPVLYLEGGPGGSALSGIDWWTDSPLRATRDVILLDQRGMGYSMPRLHCFELNELEDEVVPDDTPLSRAEIRALESCRQRLRRDGVDLGDYNSAASAADIADLRVALGFETWNLLGISYGTRLALTVMRDHPAGVRSVVLDSAYPPVVDAYEEAAVNTTRAFRRLFDDCAAGPACAAAYPTLEQDFYAMVDRLDRKPQYVADLGMDIYGTDVIYLVFDTMYFTPLIPYLPLMVHELSQGRTDTFVMLYEGSLPDDGSADDPVWTFVDEFYWLLDELDDDPYFDVLDALDSWQAGDWDALGRLIKGSFSASDAAYLLDLLAGLSPEDLDRLALALVAEDVWDTGGAYDAVECYEEIPFNSLDDAALFATGLPPAIVEADVRGLEVQMAVCAIWDTGIAPPLEDLPIASDIPTLVLAGQYDPITPPVWGYVAASTLPNSLTLEFPGVGHSVIDGGDCPLQIVQAFLDAPTQPLDARCIDAMTAPAFVLP